MSRWGSILAIVSLILLFRGVRIFNCVIASLLPHVHPLICLFRSVLANLSHHIYLHRYIPHLPFPSLSLRMMYTVLRLGPFLILHPSTTNRFLPLIFTDIILPAFVCSSLCLFQPRGVGMRVKGVKEWTTMAVTSLLVAARGMSGQGSGLRGLGVMRVVRQ
jgi:hypothetical protein